jgi:hypothetical protein
LLEFVCLELNRAGLAPIADEPDPRRVEAQEAGRVHAVASEYRLLARWAEDYERLDSCTVPRDGFASEPFADAQMNPDRLIDLGFECRRFDPEVVRRKPRTDGQQQCGDQYRSDSSASGHGKLLLF